LQALAALIVTAGAKRADMIVFEPKIIPGAAVDWMEITIERLPPTMDARKHGVTKSANAERSVSFLETHPVSRPMH
jgi:hypothetical protein